MPLGIEVVDLPSPLLQFGGSDEFSDPKIGLVHEGPFSLRFGSAHKEQVRLGLVGSPEIVAQARLWFERCQAPLPSGSPNQTSYPNFPGFRETFRSVLDLDSRWQIEVDPTDLTRALGLRPWERF